MSFIRIQLVLVVFLSSSPLYASQTGAIKLLNDYLTQYHSINIETSECTMNLTLNDEMNTRYSINLKEVQGWLVNASLVSAFSKSNAIKKEVGEEKDVSNRMALPLSLKDNHPKIISELFKYVNSSCNSKFQQTQVAMYTYTNELEIVIAPEDYQLAPDPIMQIEPKAVIVNKQSGYAKFSFDIDQLGKASNIKIMETDLDERHTYQLERALKRWMWKPEMEMLDGKPVFPTRKGFYWRFEV